MHFKYIFFPAGFFFPPDNHHYACYPFPQRIKLLHKTVLGNTNTSPVCPQPHGGSNLYWTAQFGILSKGMHLPQETIQIIRNERLG